MCVSQLESEMSNVVSNKIDDEFRWETLMTQIKKSSHLVERIYYHSNPMLNFKFEKMLVEFMKTLTQEEQKTLEFESKILADVAPSGVDPQELKTLRNDLLMDLKSTEEQYKYACSFDSSEAGEKQEIRWLTKLAEKKHKFARVRLACIHDKNKEYKQAIFWYTKAAEQGCASSQNNLAICYRHGRGVEKDEKKAFQLYQEAANANNFLAQYNLAMSYKHGFVIEKDEKMAFQWFQRAATQNHDYSLVALGCCYKNGYGVEQDHKKAVEWFRRGTYANNSLAFFHLANCYDLGLGVIQDIQRAFELYKYAADHGNQKCQEVLGIGYLHGRGVEKNTEVAFECFLKASNGDRDAATSLLKQYENV